jgi:hypothetical protein
MTIFQQDPPMATLDERDAQDSADGTVHLIIDENLPSVPPIGTAGS